MKSAISSMTLANMRAQGVRALFVYCCRCHHQPNLNVDNYPAGIPVPAFSPRMVCTNCGMIGADVRPAWNERAAVGAFNRL
jgi:NaMN:DMB phosphoribosyltransferase